MSPSPGECYDIETAQHLRLTEQDAATSDPMQPHSLSSHPSSELLHDHINTEDHSTDCTRFEAVTSHPASLYNQFSRHPKSSSLNQFGQEDDPHTDRSAIDEHGQARLLLDTHAFHKDRRQDEKQKVSSGSDEEKEEVDDARPQQETNSVEAVLMAKTSGYRLLQKMDEGSKPAGRQRPLPSHDSSPEPDQDARRSHSNDCSDYEFSSTRAEEDRRPHSIKRKQPSLSGAGPAQKRPFTFI